MPTGIDGLDKMLEGGIPKGSTVLLVGGPGTGKTILSIQFLIKGIEKYSEKGIFVCLQEKKNSLYRAMQRFSWDLPRLEKEGKFSFLDASLIRRVSGEVKTGSFYTGRKHQ